MTDDDYVDTVTQGLRESRSWMAQFNDVVQRAMQFDPVSDVVAATFDGDGYLQDLVIDPTAPAQYTHTELEELITLVLRDGSAKLREAMRKAVERYFGTDSAWREMDALAEEW